MISHLEKKAKGLINYLHPDKSEIILDIGCNDGTMLNFFNNIGVKRVGIDPSSEKFKDNFQKDIKVICEFFSEKLNALRAQNTELMNELNQIKQEKINEERRKMQKQMDDLAFKNTKLTKELKKLQKEKAKNSDKAF